MPNARQAEYSLLNHLRWLAALAVAVGHVRNHVLVDFPVVDHPGPFAVSIYFLTGYGHVAVVIFFVISGFLVGGKLVDIARGSDFGNSWLLFLVDRFTRIFIVLWPCLILTAAILFFIVEVTPAVPFAVSTNWDAAWAGPIDKDLDLAVWASNIVLLNEFTKPTVFLNGPLWSLSYEWFYYMIALAIALIARRIWTTRSLLFLVYSLCLVLLSLKYRPEIIAAGLTWTLGVAARLVADRRWLSHRAAWLGGVIAVIAVLGYTRIHPINDYIVGAAFAFMIAHDRWRDWNVAANCGKRLANFSFSLYVTHSPVCALIIVIFQSQGWLSERMAFNAKSLLIMVGILGCTITFARLFAIFTEQQTGRLRRWILKLISPMPNPAAEATA
jgi:peptidoglycan/LPS O-acetylase OafA/YrhL